MDDILDIRFDAIGANHELVGVFLSVVFLLILKTWLWMIVWNQKGDEWSTRYAGDELKVCGIIQAQNASILQEFTYMLTTKAGWDIHESLF